MSTTRIQYQDRWAVVTGASSGLSPIDGAPLQQRVDYVQANCSLWKLEAGNLAARTGWADNVSARRTSNRIAHLHT